MGQRAKITELSIIIPALNEADTIQDLIFNLAQQEDVAFEVILCDGGSTDGTPESFRSLVQEVSFPARLLETGKGRGRQMNEGAAAARGAFLLFLHADSYFDDRHALRKALDALASAMRSFGHGRVAGHFALRFRRCGITPSLFFYFHESKARLDRKECTHGDQGLMLSRSFFSAAGAFNESMPLLEDTRFAEAIRADGRWILFPAEICTSARRFETEGYAERETVNALAMTLSALGREEFLRELPRVYAGQHHARRLRLYPFFDKIRVLLSALPFRERIRFWSACGAYVAANCWQLAFLLDVLRNFRHDLPPGGGRYLYLDRFERYLSHAATAPAVKLCVAVAVRGWFGVMLVWRYVRDKGWTDETGKSY